MLRRKAVAQWITAAATPRSFRERLMLDQAQTLAETHAPIVYHEASEPNLPTNVDWILERTSLWIYDDTCTPVIKRKLIDKPKQEQLVSQQTTGCDAQRPIFSNGTRSAKKHRTFFLEDVAPEHRTNRNTEDWTTYYHLYENNLGGLTIQYWRCYSYNTGKSFLGLLQFGFHGGDWEGIHVILGSDLKPVSVRLLGHTGIEEVPWTKFRLEDGHPRIKSELGGHSTSTFLESKETSFIRQESWAGGHVRWPNGSVSAVGPLLNVGKKTAPLNNQVFIQYSGLWGSPSQFPKLPTFYFNSGYWGPAYNETSMGEDGFITAWSTGARFREQGECYPAAVSP
jgi:hypothetical protein